MKKVSVGFVKNIEELVENKYYKIEITDKYLSENLLEGQFVNIKCGDTPLLRRPISIFNVDKNKGTYEIVFEKKGLGTSKLSNFKVGDKFDVIGPLGHGFSIAKCEKKALLVGGGVGIPPLYLLGKRLKEKGVEVTYVLGFQEKEHIFLLEDFEEIGNVHISTNDGSFGQKGHVGNIIDGFTESDFDCVYSCGPGPMLKYLQNKDFKELEVSLEEYMGCGIGACLSCACEKKDGSYERVCTEGPVFKGSEVII